MNRKKKDVNAAEDTERNDTAEQDQVEETTDEAEVIEDADTVEAAESEQKDPAAAELEKQKENYLRLAAEYDNFRKRTVREKEALSADIKGDCVTALLPVIDNLERAIAADNASTEDLRKGIDMVISQASQIFEKLGVKAFCEPGDRFDPQLHHCIGMVESEEFEPDQVALVIQKGYMLGDKVIRPAMVQVVQ